MYVLRFVYSFFCGDAPEASSKSCSTVVAAAVQASYGDRSSVEDYMNAVCGENKSSGWHAKRCTELTSSVTDSVLDPAMEIVKTSIPAPYMFSFNTMNADSLVRLRA